MKYSNIFNLNPSEQIEYTIEIEWWIVVLFYQKKTISRAQITCHGERTGFVDKIGVKIRNIFIFK